MQASKVPALLALLAMATGAVTALDASCSNGRNGTLSLTGQGQVTLEPDIGMVTFTISAKAPSARAARDEAAEAAAAILSAREGAPGGALSADDVSTLSVSLSQAYRTSEGNTVPDGYRFAQQMQVKVQNVTGDNLAAAVDAVVTAGGNSVAINSIQTKLSDENQLAAMNESRRLAVQNGLQTARLLTEAAGVSLVAITSMSDSNTAPSTTRETAYAAAPAAATAAASAPATAINIQDSSVSSRVSMSFATCSQMGG